MVADHLEAEDFSARLETSGNRLEPAASSELTVYAAEEKSEYRKEEAGNSG